jgi:hypothetical protein|tara:strand:- start:7992 stop:8249 length:258 start_codon:yes stop_codon:yes gene_type:complete
MREMLIGAARTYYMGMINKHLANMEVLLTNPVGIGEDSHQDIQAVIEIELGKIADYHDKLEVLQKFFVKPQQQQEENKDDKKDKK